MTRDIINQVREMLDRHLNVVEIASKLNLDLETVRTAADIIKELIT
jgi:orotate phosphoribosyltransferase-like protein